MSAAETFGETELKKGMHAALGDGTFGFVAFLTDSVTAGEWSGGKLNPDVGVELLLDIRVFSVEKELHALRMHLGEPFKCRIACEKGLDKDEYFEEIQFLDIDGTTEKDKPPDALYKSSAGGSYALPPLPGGARARRIKIVNYLKYDDETGNMQAVDFRIKEVL
jgi:hypothetical protein